MTSSVPSPGAPTPPDGGRVRSKRSGGKRRYMVPVKSLAVREVYVWASSDRDALQRVVHGGEGECLDGVQFSDETYGRVRRAPEDSRRTKRHHQGACMECGRFLKPYGDGWHDGVHTDCKEPSR